MVRPHLKSSVAENKLKKKNLSNKKITLTSQGMEKREKEKQQ